MILKDTGQSFTVYISDSETHKWAMKGWPCSFLAGKRLRATFDRNGLSDMAIEGGTGDQDCPADEFNACIVDHLKSKLPVTHPCYFVAVGQFL